MTHWLKKRRSGFHRKKQKERKKRTQLFLCRDKEMYLFFIHSQIKWWRYDLWVKRKAGQSEAGRQRTGLCCANNKIQYNASHLQCNQRLDTYLRLKVTLSCLVLSAICPLLKGQPLRTLVSCINRSSKKCPQILWFAWPKNLSIGTQGQITLQNKLLCMSNVWETHMCNYFSFGFGLWHNVCYFRGLSVEKGTEHL